jgi:peptide/nickel transport system substrate-binding protein
MAEIGLELELRYEDVPTWIKRVYGDYDFEMNVNYFYQLPDPVIGVQRHYGTDQIRSGTPFVNSTRYSNPKVDELLAAGAVEPDAATRTEIYAEVSAILGEELPVVNLFEMEFLTVYNEALKDHTVSAMGAYGSFDRAYIEE